MEMMRFTIKKAAADEIETVIQIIQTVLHEMPNPEWFAADNADYTRSQLLSGTGTAYLAIEKSSLTPAGVFLAAFPGSSSENLGLDAGLSEKELPYVAHMNSAAVLPAFRGCHLQRLLMQTAEKELRTAGYRYLFCTVHPDNRYSLNSVLSLGYEIITICEKYGGYLRAVLMKRIG